jgi:hypothetical protein
MSLGNDSSLPEGTQPKVEFIEESQIFPKLKHD